MTGTYLKTIIILCRYQPFLVRVIFPKWQKPPPALPVFIPTDASYNPQVCITFVHFSLII